MESLSTSVLDESIEAEKAEGKQRIGEYVQGVQERVVERTDALQEAFGDGARSIIEGIKREASEYGRTQKEIFGEGASVGDTASKGAAAWNDKGAGNEIVFDHDALDREKDEAYWSRVRDHEEVHQKEQASRFKGGPVTFEGETCAVIDIIEGHAIESADQPDSDLTPGYREHRKKYVSLIAHIGSGPVLEAVRSGDLERLQELIQAKAISEMLKGGSRSVEMALAA